MNALVKYEKPLSPFARFLRTVEAGAGLPVPLLRQMLASAMVVLMYKLHDQLFGRTPSNEVDYHRAMNVLERRLVVGMHLVHGSPQDAAQALAQNVRSLPVPTVITSVSDWAAKPLAKALAPLLKASRGYLEETTQAYGQLVAKNKQGDYACVSLERVDSLYHSIQYYLGSADLVKELFAPADVAHLQQEMARAHAGITLLKRMRLYPKNWPANIMSLEEQWLAAQVVLALNDANEDRDVVTVDEYIYALACAKTGGMDVSSIVARILRRAKGNPAEEEVSWLTAEVASKIDWLNRLSDTQIGVDSSLGILMHIELRQSGKITEKDALEIVGGNTVGDTRHEKLQEKEAKQWIVDEVLPKVPWAKLTPHEVRQIIDEGVVPPVPLAQGILKMSRDAKEAALLELRHDREYLQQCLPALLEAGILSDVAEDLGLVDVGLCPQTAPAIWSHLVRRYRSGKKSQRLSEVMAKTLVLLPQEQLLDVFQDVSLRRTIMENVLFEEGSMVPQIVDRLREVLGVPLYMQILLALEALLRAETYPDTKTVPGVEPLIRWMSVPQERRFILPSRYYEGISDEELKRFFRKIPEKNAYLFAMEGKSDAMPWETVAQHRRRYFSKVS